MTAKRAAAVAVETPWTSDAPAIACAREFHVVGDGEQFTMRLVDVPIEFELDRPRFDHGELIGQLTVRTDLTGARTFQGVLSVGTLNCSSPTARKTRAHQLAELACAPQIDFLRLVEEFAIRVHTAMRTGGEAVDLRTLPRPARADNLDVHGIRLLDGHPITMFGDGGCAKSYLALFIAGALAMRGLTVLYADWELSAEDHRDRLERLFGATMPPMLYARCSRPMSTEADRLRRLVRQHNVAFLVNDSIAFACDGRPEDADVAARYFQALRQIGVGSLNVAHTNRSEESDKKPFGSAFWHNGARATWNIKLSNDTRPGEIIVGAYNRKANLGPLLPAVGFRMAFSPEQTHITRVDLGTVDDLAAGLPLWQRMRQAVTHGPQTLAALADDLGAKPDTLDRTVRRYNKTFTRVSGVDGISKIALVHGVSV